MIVASFVATKHRNVTDGRTDGRTDRQTDGQTASWHIQRCKNRLRFDDVIATSLWFGLWYTVYNNYYSGTYTSLSTFNKGFSEKADLILLKWVGSTAVPLIDRQTLVQNEYVCRRQARL